MQVRAMAEPEEETRSTASNKRSRSELEENQVNGLFLGYRILVSNETKTELTRAHNR